MNRFVLPEWLKNTERIPKLPWSQIDSDLKKDLRARLASFSPEKPVATICIPAWNEELNLPRTLDTLANQICSVPVEILIVDNNSTDATAVLARELGVRVVNEPKQGIAFTRQRGLIEAKGEIYLCSDADTLYPPKWAETLIKPLSKPGISGVYGTYSFVPEGGISRFSLAIYELIAEKILEFRKFRREYLNVRGPNFAFRKADGIDVKGFEMKITRKLGDRSVVYGEDGRMARKLGEIGKLKLLRSKETRIFTSCRQLTSEGSLLKVFMTRVVREGSRMSEYLFGSFRPIQTSDHI